MNNFGYEFNELVTGYFNINESMVHLDAKEKLFELIKSKRIKIKDQFGEYYDVFDNQHTDEFLHVESFVMGYSNEALFSNVNTPCKNYKEIEPLCKQEGYFGAFKELPCSKCVLNNVGDIQKSSKFASYRPDVSFGYSGVHKIWFEIKHTNKSSYNKMRFCHENDIVLLEIDASIVEDFKDYNGELEFNRLLYKPVEFKTEKYDEIILDSLNKDGYVLVSDIKKLLQTDKFEYTFNKLGHYDMYDQLVERHDLVELFDGHEGIKNHFGFKGKRKILIKSSDVSKINGIRDDFDKQVNDKIEQVINSLVLEVEENGFMLQKEFKDRAMKLMPKGYKKVNMKDILSDNDLVSVRMEDHLDKLIKLKLEVNPRNIRNNIILPNKIFKCIVN